MCVYIKACTHLSLSLVAYSTPGSAAPNRFVGIGTRDNFLNIPQQTQVRPPPFLHAVPSIHPSLLSRPRRGVPPLNACFSSF